MKLSKAIKVGEHIVPAGTELQFSQEGVSFFRGTKVLRNLIPALEAFKPQDVQVPYYYAKVYRYDANMQKLTGSKVKPEPWLHIAIKTHGWFVNGVGPMPKVPYVIYVWDSREVQGEGELKIDATKGLSGEHVPDSHTALKGGGASAKTITSDFNEIIALFKAYANATSKTGMTVQELDAFPKGEYNYGGHPVKLSAKLPWRGITVQKWLDEKKSAKRMKEWYAGAIDLSNDSSKMNKIERLNYLAEVLPKNKIKPIRRR